MHTGGSPIQDMRLDNKLGSLLVRGIVTSSSSLRYKTDVQPIGSADALAAVLKLQGVTYSRKDKTAPRLWTGLIAEDVVKIIPSVVLLNDDGQPDSIAYTELVPYLIESVKQLNSQVTSLSTEVAELRRALQLLLRDRAPEVREE